MPHRILARPSRPASPPRVETDPTVVASFLSDAAHVPGGFAAGVKFYDALTIFKRLVNIGDAKSLAAHPASTTHRQMTEAEQKQAGVTPDMIRLCIGIEAIDDILADLELGFAAAK